MYKFGVSTASVELNVPGVLNLNFILCAYPHLQGGLSFISCFNLFIFE